MKQTSKLVSIALIGNLSAKKIYADDIYLQFLDDGLFDDSMANPTIGGPTNDTIYMNDAESRAQKQRLDDMMAQKP